MTFWIAAGLLTLAAVAALLLPLLRRDRSGADPADPPDPVEYDLSVYRDQLSQIDADRVRGLIGAVEADSARAEIARRILAADARRNQAEASPRRRSTALAALIAIALPVTALLVYAELGAPDLPGVPFVERDDTAGPDIAARRAAVQQLSRRLEESPDDLRGWVRLAQTHMELSDYERAAEAYARALGLDEGNAELHAAYGEALTAAAGNVVTPASRAAFETALFADPDNHRAQFYLALADEQAGRAEAALERWRILLEASPPDAPWVPLARQRAADTVKALGLDPATALPAPKEAPRGPSAADIAAAEQMSQEERLAMIGAMVDGLAARLQENPDDLEGWLRLGRAYMVLDRHAEARDAVAEAARLAPDDIGVLTLYGRTLRAAAGDRQTPESVAVMRDILVRDPDNIEALWLVGLAEIDAGERDPGLAKMQRALDNIPPGTPQRDALAEQLDALKKDGS